MAEFAATRPLILAQETDSGGKKEDAKKEEESAFDINGLRKWVIVNEDIGYVELLKNGDVRVTSAQLLGLDRLGRLTDIKTSSLEDGTFILTPKR